MIGYILGIIFAILIIWLYISVVSITIQGLTPLKKYQRTTTNDPALNVWAGSVSAIILASAAISLRVYGIQLWYLNVPVIAGLYGLYAILAGVSRRDIHADDPEVKTGWVVTAINVCAVSIPILVTVLGSAGLSAVLGSAGSAFVLFFILAFPVAIGSSCVMLCARVSSSILPVYVTLAVLCIVTGVIANT